MSRKNRRADQSVPLRPIGSVNLVQSHSDGDWVVRSIAGSAAAKTYRCPGCEQEIRPGVAHVVAWRTDRPEGEAHRRHWHTPCWSARSRRRPG